MTHLRAITRECLLHSVVILHIMMVEGGAPFRFAAGGLNFRTQITQMNTDKKPE